MKVTLLASFLMVGVVGITSLSLADGSLASSQWISFTRQGQRFAMLSSKNEIALVPQRDSSKLMVVLRNSPEGGKSAYLIINGPGQFQCENTCTIMAQLDEGERRPFDAEISNGKTEGVLIRGYDTLVANLKRAKKLVIEAEFAQAGSQMFSFEIPPLDWE